MGVDHVGGEVLGARGSTAAAGGGPAIAKRAASRTGTRGGGGSVGAAHTAAVTWVAEPASADRTAPGRVSGASTSAGLPSQHQRHGASRSAIAAVAGAAALQTIAASRRRTAAMGCTVVTPARTVKPRNRGAP